MAIVGLSCLGVVHICLQEVCWERRNKKYIIINVK